jgi:hypothetical protein
MPVTSAPLGSSTRPAARPSPAIMPRGCVITAALVMLRVIAIALILASTFGNYVQFVGGWASYWPPHWTILLYAAIYQAICSLFQWGFKAMRWWLSYTLALIASAIPSFLTYNALFGPNLTTQIGLYPTIVAVFLFVVAGDALPEWVLVE